MFMGRAGALQEAFRPQVPSDNEFSQINVRATARSAQGNGLILRPAPSLIPAGRVEFSFNAAPYFFLACFWPHSSYVQYVPHSQNDHPALFMQLDR
jgi:hypothetical protein